MVETILIISFSFLSILGLCELIHIIWIWAISPSIPIKKILVVYLNNDFPTEQLKLTIACDNWSAVKNYNTIIAVAVDLSEENYEVCEKIAFENNIVICPEAVAQRVIKSIARG